MFDCILFAGIGVAAPHTRNNKEKRKVTFWIVLLSLSQLLQNAVEFESMTRINLNMG